MKIEQFVMAYGVEQDRLRAILPEGFASLRPVLRVNAEIADGKTACIEYNTAVEHDGKKGWLNIGFWRDVAFTKEGKTTSFQIEHLAISFTRVGVQGACPAEKDNDGCCFLAAQHWRVPDMISSQKEFCDGTFQWDIDGGASGKSIGKTLPAIPTEPNITYPKTEFTVTAAASIPCNCVLGAYAVEFERDESACSKMQIAEQ